MNSKRIKNKTQREDSSSDLSWKYSIITWITVHDVSFLRLGAWGEAGGIVSDHKLVFGWVVVLMFFFYNEFHMNYL